MVSVESTSFTDVTSGWQSGTVDVSGGHLAYHRTGGSGPALLMLHGLTDNGLCWRRVAAALAPEYDVVMLDARGHGASAQMTVGKCHDPVQDIAEVVEHLGLMSLIVMGHSVGARAAAEYAGAYPERVSKVILEDPPFLPLASPSETIARREKFRLQVKALHALSNAEIAARGKQDHPSWQEDEFPAWVAGKRQVDPDAVPTYSTLWQEAVARIRAPVLLICGENARGGIVTPQIAEEACRLNPQIRAVQIDGAGHNIRRENYHGYLDAVRAFLCKGAENAL